MPTKSNLNWYLFGLLITVYSSIATAADADAGAAPDTGATERVPSPTIAEVVRELDTLVAATAGLAEIQQFKFNTSQILTAQALEIERLQAIQSRLGQEQTRQQKKIKELERNTQALLVGTGAAVAGVSVLATAYYLARDRRCTIQ